MEQHEGNNYEYFHMRFRDPCKCWSNTHMFFGTLCIRTIFQKILYVGDLCAPDRI